jgi:hypothetical protein
MPPHVWYAAYGSNLSRDRFDRYLRGGVPTGGRRHYPGAADRTPPSHDRAATLPWPLRFAGASRTWGGGMAFVDPGAPGRTLARLYRITPGQFADVHAQENGGDADPADVGDLVEGDHVTAGRGNYPVIVCAGRLDDAPVLTFTTQRMPAAAAPAAAYLRAIAAGLAESHRLDVAAIADYLRAAPSVARDYGPAALCAVVRAGVAAAMVAPPRHVGPS